jgi:signal transduction histidine kinase
MGLAAKQPALEHREDLAPFALAGISAGVLVCDPAGGVLYASAPLVSLLGGELRQVGSEKGPEGNGGGSIRGQFVEALGEALRMEKPLDRLLTVDDDRRRAFYLTVVPQVDARGNRLRVAHLMDLSALVARGDLIADVLRQVRHDLRGPLTSLLGAIELMQTERVGRLEERQRRLLQIMEKATQSMSELVTELLGGKPAGSKSEAGNEGRA